MNRREPSFELAKETTYGAIVGQVLVFLRRQQGVRQADLAAVAGVGQSTWSRIEAGVSALNVEQLGRAAAALGIGPGELLARADESARALESQGIRVHRERRRGKKLALALIGAAALGLLVARALRR